MVRLLKEKVSVYIDLLFILILLLAIPPKYVIADPVDPVADVTLVANPVSSQLVNTPVTFTATATGGGASKEYEFAVQDPVVGVMTVMQPYGPSNSFTFTPTNAGTYGIRVYVRNVGSPAPYEAARWNGAYYVTVNAPVTGVTIGAIPTSSQLVNTPVTFTATATGGGANKEYEFAVKDPVVGVMTVMQPYGPSNSFTYTPTNAGTYGIRVYARNIGSTAPYEAVQWNGAYYVTVAAPVTGVTLGASPASPQLVNTPVTFTATATGGGASKEYEFAVKDPVIGVMTVMQPYGASNIFPYTPTNAGTYSIRVYVRNVGSGASYEAVVWFTDNVVTSPPVTSVTLGASPASPQLVNTPVIFTATATGGGASKEYEFAVKDPVSGVMTVRQPYGSSNNFSYTLTTAGTNTIQVYARNVGSAASYEAAGWYVYNMMTSSKISNVAASSNTINTSAFETSTIFFTISSQATVTLKIIPEKEGPSGTPIFQTSQNCSAVGTYFFTWDGKDSTGKTVPDEAYLYILEATNGPMTTVYSPSAPTGTWDVSCSQGTSYDPYRNEPLTINYSVSQPARVDLSINWSGSIFKIMDAIPMASGSYAFDWNGRSPDGRILSGGAVAQCAVASPLRENVIITSGNTPVVTFLKTDPYDIQLSYGEFTRITYMLSRDANVTVRLIPAAGETIVLLNSQAQTAGAHEIVWDGIDPSDASGKKLLLAKEGYYSVSIQAGNPVTGANSSNSGCLRMWQ